MKRTAMVFGLAFILAGFAAAQSADTEVGSTPQKPGFDVDDALSGLTGQWTGQLQYLDYQSGNWFGLPMTLDITKSPDGYALTRTAAFDDGPSTGMVYITTISAYNSETGVEESAQFRIGRAMVISSARLSLDGEASADSWTLVALSDGFDDDRPATIRETTVRDGDGIISLKEVDYADDEVEDWLTRNRTLMTRIED